MSLIRIDYSLLKSEGLKQGRWLKGEEVQRTEPVLLDVSNSALSMATGNWPSGLGLMMGQGFAKVGPSLSWPTPHPRRAVCLKVHTWLSQQRSHGSDRSSDICASGCPRRMLLPHLRSSKLSALGISKKRDLCSYLGKLENVSPKCPCPRPAPLLSAIGTSGTEAFQSLFQNPGNKMKRLLLSVFPNVKHTRARAHTHTVWFCGLHLKQEYIFIWTILTLPAKNCLAFIWLVTRNMEHRFPSSLVT